jgi:stage II sporulation protein D
MARRSWSGRAATALALVGVLVAGTGAAADAAEVYPRPADGTFTVVGHGNGHGHGMSQYGALGAARAGRSWQEIIAFYYPGTTLGSIGNTTIRVRVASLGSAVEAYPASGLSVKWNVGQAASSVLPATRNGVTVARWRMVPSAKVAGAQTRFRLEYLPTGSATWVLHATASVPLTGAFLNPTTGTVTTRREGDQVVYRGEVRGTLIGAAGAESLVPVVALPLESYLRTVVPGEVFASWPQDTLRAQAVAARSFAAYHRRFAPISRDFYDVYDDTRSQVFEPTSVNGATNEVTSTNTAISATANTAALYQGEPAYTQFSASDGGWSSAGNKPYLVAKRDDWDAVADNPYHRWTATVKVSTLEDAFPSIGSFRSLTIKSRNGLGDLGGRVLTATLTGSRDSVDVTGEQLRSSMGIGRSDWFRPTLESSTSFPRDVTGDGRADLLAVVRDTGALRVYAGNGSGGSSSVTVPEASGWNAYPKVLTAGTWDADTVSDVLVQDTAGGLWLRRGNGDATFAAPVKIGTGWQAANLVFPVGDFNGDRLTDLMVRMQDGSLFLYPGNGTGGFKARAQLASGWQSVATAFSPGDFTGDRVPDILYISASGELWLVAGNGSGGFRPQTRIGLGWQIYGDVFSPGDFDGNGRGDILARQTSDGALYLYSGNGAGGASGRRQIGSGWQIFSAILK